jgi:hypothetical protein
MSPRRDESAFRHGLRVRIGKDGPKGKLLHCEKRDGTGKYWKVRLNSGEWRWPDGIVIDGPGDHFAGHCLDCRLPFIGDSGDLLCRACQGEMFGETAERSQGAEDTYFARRAGRRR